MTTDLASNSPASPAAPAGDTADTNGDTVGEAPSVVSQTRKAHGLVSRARPRHRRSLPR
jgi:hypothetical protein